MVRGFSFTNLTINWLIFSEAAVSPFSISVARHALQIQQSRLVPQML